MRPHDIVILLKIATLGDRSWFAKDLAQSLKISAGEVSESLNRSKIAGLLSMDKKRLLTNNLLDFISHGLAYVYPAEIGAFQRGMPTASSAPPLNQFISSKEITVWPRADGKTRGQAIEPLHPSVPFACDTDPLLYQVLALVDAVRVGRSREKSRAIEELRKRLIN